MAQAHAGDERAYTALLEELAVVIRAYLINRLGFSDAVEDFVQESLIAIHEGRHSYDPERPFRPWLFAIVRHKTIDCLRKTPHQKVEFNDDSTYEPNYSDHLDSARIMQTLPPQLGETLFLTKFLGYSQAECALRQGISVASVKIRTFRAIKQLKTRWAE